MSGEIPDGLLQYIMGEQHRNTIPTALAEAVKVESRDIALEAAAAKTHDYIEAVFRTEKPSPLASDFKKRNGVFLLMPSMDPEVRQSESPQAVHLVTAYGADTDNTGHYGRDFHQLVTESSTHHPLHTSLEDYTQRRLGWSVEAESGHGSDYLSLGPIQEHLSASAHQGNEDWIMRNADPYSLALLLTASPTEVVESVPGALAIQRKDLVSALDQYRQNNPDSFRTYWEGLALVSTSLPRIDFNNPAASLHSYDDYRARVLAS